MLKYFAERGLEQFRERYDYDVSYMEHMLNISPNAFFKFAKIMDASKHHEAAPVDALYAAKIVGAVTEDCGPCVQLVVKMAGEAGMGADQIKAVLKRDIEAMNEDTALGYHFADAVVRRAYNADEVRDSVRTAWGDAGVIDLALGLQVGRLFPMIKAALGYAITCHRVEIDDVLFDVVKTAA